MSNAPDMTELSKRLTSYVSRAWAQLYWERYAPVFALAALFISLFLIGAFGGVWDRLGDPWRLIALLMAIGILIRAGLKARAIIPPNKSAARRRVEDDSGIKHRPLDTLDDAPAIGAKAWPTHFAKAQKAAEKLRPTIRRHALAPMDKYYLRYAIPCAVGLAMMVGFGDNSERLRRALTPSWQAGMNPNDVSFEAWLDPPQYTGRPPLYFKNKKQIDVPAGSELVARISGTKNAPRLRLSSSRGGKYLKLKRLGPKSFETRAVVTKSGTARWRIGTLEKKWALNVLEDTPPTLEFTSTPEADKRDRLAFNYTFEDDYGVESLQLEMRLLNDDETLAAARSSVTVPLASSSVKRAEDKSAALDLTKHEWAGRKVAGQLIAIDGLGQIAKTQDVFFTIPDKIFIEPLAKAIIEQRNLIIEGAGEYAPYPEKYDYRKAPYFDTYEPDFRLSRAPAQIQRAALLMDAITERPKGLFQDPAIFMGLKHVHSRLRYSREQAELTGIPEDLWRIALRAEFGVLGTALEEMRAAQAALQDGIARRAPQREIDTLFERYDEAVERYMEELRRKAIEEGNVAEQDGGEGAGGRNVDQIAELLKAIEEANRIGDTEGARKALAQLAALLENMEIQLSKGGSGSEGEPSGDSMSEEEKEALEDLADLLGDQRELQDETRQAENEAQQEGEDGQSGEDGQPSGQASGEQNRQSQGGQNPSRQNPSANALTPGELAQQQKAIEQALTALGEAIGEEGFGEDSDEGQGGGGKEDPDSEARGGGGSNEDGEDGTGGESLKEQAERALAEAGEAMRDSQERLQDGDLSGANDAQAEAIRALRRAGEHLAEGSRGKSAKVSENGEETDDPLGRDGNGVSSDTADADIEQKDNATRSRELREELRRRAAEQERDQFERNYLERLLKQF